MISSYFGVYARVFSPVCIYSLLICIHYQLYITNNTSCRATQETFGKLANDVATAVATELKTFSAQVPVSQIATKQEFTNTPDLSILPTTSFNQFKDSGTPGQIFTPPLLPQLDSKDYEDIFHWGPEKYLASRKPGDRGGKKSLAGTKDPSILSSFMEQSDGTQVSDKDKQAVRRTARAFFEALLKNNRAPTTWGNAPINIQHQLINVLETEYPFLRFCDQHWKSLQVATNSYSQWYITAISRKTGIEAREAVKGATKKSAKVEVIDVDPDDVINIDTDENESVKVSKCPRDVEVAVPESSKRSRIEDPHTASASRPRPRPTNVNPQGQKVRK